MIESMPEASAPAHKARLHPQSPSGSHTKIWHFKHFRNFENAQAALTYINTPPAQGADEISATIRDDGSVGMFYYV
jgi:hypothetical protein